jgi:glucose/arabinose dehydrogenase
MLALLLAATLTQPPAGDYQKKDTRAATAQATLASLGLPTLAGDWHWIGPFDNSDGVGFDAVYPPEKEIDFAAKLFGKGNLPVGWKPLKCEAGKPINMLPLVRPDRNDVVVYLALKFEAKDAVRLPVSLGADDTLSVFFNGKRLLHEKHERAVAADQFRIDLDVRVGKNELLLKVGQIGGQYGVVFEPLLPASLSASVRKQYERDFPPGEQPGTWPKVASVEAKHFPVTTLEPPHDCVLEVGGLAFRPDGQLLVCTRRGEIWRVKDPATRARFTRVAHGLHEPLGMHVVTNDEIYVIQRPELSRLRDPNTTGTFTDFETVCDRFGVSGDYHEYSFGPARAKDGSFFVTLNVGFGGGHQAKVPYRGWCVRIDPKSGAMEPYAYGLRSPNGVNFSPDGDLFYADNQGEWVATNKLHHVQKGDFFGHQASLKWLPDSPFKADPAEVKSGMRYDADPAPKLSPPAVWFPYGRMGQSVTEPVWDTTGGKFGPFAGQCFLGDQTRASVMRVAMEKVDGVWQGACFPFRNGLQCGVNRLAFGPDGSLYAGQTNRGWGSIGGKPFGLQRIAYGGTLPFEIHHITMTKTGFDVHFTKPIAEAPTVLVKSFTYLYHSTYGSPEIDTQSESTTATKTGDAVVSVTVPTLRRGRVYDFGFGGAKATDGTPLLHPEAYYTVNRLAK